MGIKSEIIFGKSISDIPEESRIFSEDLENEDLILISRKCLKLVSDDRTYEIDGKTVGNEYKSCAISYGDLSSSLYDYVYDKISFGSMAWESSSDYSLRNHIHNYQNIGISDEIDNSEDEDKILIGKISLDGYSKSIYVPKTYVYSHKNKPIIGELKFVGDSNLPEIDENAEGFDGWIYPDGRYLDKISFSDAYSFFGDSYGSNDSQFRLPCLSDFLEMNPFTCMSSNIFQEHVEWNEDLINHSHGITNMTLSGNIEGTIEIGYSSKAGTVKGQDNQFIHARKWTSTNGHITSLVAFECDELTCTQSNIVSSGNDVEPYPSHTTIPVLMFIGEKNA